MRRSLREKVLGRPGLIGLVAGAALVGSALGGVAYAQTPAPDTGPGTQTQAPTPGPGETPAKPGCPEQQGSAQREQRLAYRLEVHRYSS